MWVLRIDLNLSSALRQFQKNKETEKKKMTVEHQTSFCETCNGMIRQQILCLKLGSPYGLQRVFDLAGIYNE